MTTATPPDDSVTVASRDRSAHAFLSCPQRQDHPPLAGTGTDQLRVRHLPRLIREGHEAGAPAPVMVLGGVASLEGGAVLARGLFATAGVPGVVALRLGFGAVMLGGLRRPRLRGDWRTVTLVAVTGIVLAIHHLAFYAAVARLPLGVATTLEFCGPLAVALAGSRRALHLLWAILAAAGVVLASGFGTGGHWQGPGVALALAAAACWACYITAVAAASAGASLDKRPSPARQDPSKGD
jgi:threonine/homoserine efflux transporter RhtA